ncbi:MAG: hypothetical protein JXA83_03575 [Acidimicrobiales bacterium]|nr:hypothetical protein [Acidimicrobiales bacterium]
METDTSTRTARRLAARAGTAGLLLAALIVPAYATAPGSEPVDVVAAQAPEGEATSTSSTTAPVDGTTTTTTAVDGDGTTTTTVADDTTETTVPVGDEMPPGEEMPTDGHDGDTDHGEADDPPHHDGDPTFPDEWTPEQVAYAEQLIADTEAALERYRNPGILPLLGFTWILDGTEQDAYQHWVNLPWFGDGREIDPEYPESLVFRNTADGPVLEAAMYMLPWGYNLSNIPEDIAWLPGWHVHDNLCFDGNGRIVDIAEDGVCEAGFLVVTPPMIHVWLVDTPCGRFAGVDENGLQCDHEH